MGSLICFVLPALMTITITTVAQTRQKYQAQVSLRLVTTVAQTKQKYQAQVSSRHVTTVAQTKQKYQAQVGVNRIIY